MIPKQDGDDLRTCLNLQKVLFDEVLSEWKRNYGSRKFPDYRPLCTYVRKVVNGRIRTNFDLHYVNPSLSDGGSADVAFYVLKYMMKPSSRQIRLQQALKLNLPDDEFEDVWKLVRCRHFESDRFGLGTSDKKVIPEKIAEHLRKGIDLSKKTSDELIPSYFSPLDGKSHPLARYYRQNNEIFTNEDFFDFFYNSKKSRVDNMIIPDYDHISQIFKSYDDFDKKEKIVSYRQTADEFDDLFDTDNSDFFDLDL